ncbi:MAG: NmrA family NAD(P)-binding protein, partial [Frankiaceae bacterium]|nr:NmrA family NAD(P)-binding protein [Frankiaceae bacterium]
MPRPPRRPPAPPPPAPHPGAPSRASSYAAPVEPGPPLGAARPARAGIVIAGGTGYVGAHIARALADRGVPVLALTRDEG